MRNGHIEYLERRIVSIRQEVNDNDRKISELTDMNDSLLDDVLKLKKKIERIR